MLTYRLVNNLKENEDAQWQDLVKLSLGEKIHPSRIKGFCLGRQALRECFQERGVEIAISELQLESFCSLKSLPSLTVSISHTPEWGAAIIGDKNTYLSVGIDVEPIERVVKAAILQRISHPEDLELEAILVWSLKEASFKALMNSQNFTSPIEFSSIQLLDKKWIHSASGIQGFWEAEMVEGMCLAYAWIPCPQFMAI